MINYKKLHDLSFKNELLVKKSEYCGCYYCAKLFKSSEIKDWVNDRPVRTAICPYCHIDSVLQESDDGTYELNEELLRRMRGIFFGRHTD